MNLLPLVWFFDDPAGMRWTVLFAGPLTRRMLPGLQRHVVFRAAGEQFVAEHDWINQLPTEAELSYLLQRARSSSG
jgi:hypothetical protein